MTEGNGRRPPDIEIPVGPMAGPGAPIRVGKRLPGVNVGEARSMLLGQEVPEEVAERAQKGSERAHPDLAGHVPQVAALASPSRGWGVFCMRCSAEEQEYIYPCKIAPEGWPPQVLFPPLPPGDGTAEVTGE